MALDRQKILNDLGSVMNQLQSADCGCMGKLFSSPGQVQGVGGQGCGSHCWRNQGYGHPCSGEPYSMNQQAPGMHGRPCMGHCNPPKLYADTYSYLNQNLMQPVVKEVYEDLKGICPANAIMNDPLGAQMGLAQNTPKSPVVRGNMGQVMGQSPMGDVMGGQNAMQESMPADNSMSMGMGGGQQQSPMAGMGAEIVNMMMKSNKSQPMNMGQGGQQPTQGGAMNPQMAQGGTMNSQMGANQGLYSGNMEGMGQAQSMGAMDPNAAQYNATVNQGLYNAVNTPILSSDQYSAGNMGANQNQYYAGNTGMTNMGHSGIGNAVPENQTAVPQYMNQQNAYTVGSAQGNAMPNMAGNMNPSPQMNNMQGRQGGQQMPAQRGNYGQHAQGVAKFNEMFPGVMQGLGGDLDFDPMSIAIQMNPANKQHATMETMQRLMSGKGGANKTLDSNAAAMKPVMNGMNAVAANLNQNQLQPGQEAQNQQQYNTGMAGNQPNQLQQQIVNTAITDPQMNQQMPPQQGLQQQTLQQQTPQQQVPQQFALPQEQVVQGMDQNYQEQLPPQPRTRGAVNLPNGGYPNQISATPQQMIKEPIFPVDTSKSAVGGQNVQYNTLGQPIEALSVNAYRTKEPGLPQTLSPQPTSQQNYSNVKSTVSKTSLFANMAGGRTPSRARMQQVYNQYKGSQSYTNQNIQNIRTPTQQFTASEGHLKVNQPNLPRLKVPVEKVGGDTNANNQIPVAQVDNVKGNNNIGQLGDGAANNKPQGDADQAPMKSGKLRNGLQDMVFTSYPQSAAWSFHGYSSGAPYSSMYRR